MYRKLSDKRMKYCIDPLRFRYSFICQGTSTKAFSVFESSCHLFLPV